MTGNGKSPDGLTGKVIGSAKELPWRSDSLQLIFTSPPYNVGIEYDDYHDLIEWEDYTRMANAAMEEAYRVLKTGGKLCVNVQNSVFDWTNRSMPKPKNTDPRVSLTYLWQSAAYRAGFKFRDVVNWDQGQHSAGVAWGSWKQPSNVNIRGCREDIIVMYKDSWNAKSTSNEKGEPFLCGDELLGGKWTDLVTNNWKINPTRMKGFPVPFPATLPARAIRLFSSEGDFVGDIFCGSEQTAKAALELNRIPLGVDLA